MIYKFSFIEKLLLSNDLIPHPFADAGCIPVLGKSLGVAVKLKITDQLGKNEKSADEIARGAGVSTKGAELILDCLTALGYAERSGSGYRFSKRGEKTLDRNSPQSMVNFIEFSDWTLDATANLEDTILNGKPSQLNLEHFTEREWELFSRAMIDIAKTNVREIASKIDLPPHAKSIIDLGGSHGLYSIALCEKVPDLCAYILDLEPVKKYADECIARKDMSARVFFNTCNFLTDELPSSQDGALLFNIIHGFSEEQNISLFRKIYQSLNAGGKLFMLDQIKGVGGRSQLSMATTAFMAINLFHQANGNTYSFEEVKNWCEAAGFKNAKLQKLKAPGFALIHCTK
ncbi:MAG: hypothetical protein IT266_00850 [Saprospiraceae bacterium]|nr:hypothetical protein [Saprospiraceae bacterium]